VGEPPFRMEGIWNGMKLAIEWLPNVWFKLYAEREDRDLIKGLSQVLQFVPSFSYNDVDGTFIAEWWRQDGEKKYEDIKGHPNFTNIKTYKR
jgi:hypothetical protein